jgi:GAF domain-containing protein
MQASSVHIEVPQSTRETWQDIVDLLGEIVAVPAALIMRVTGPAIEVFVASSSEDNPYRPGEGEELEDSGLYCETVIRTGEKLLVPDAEADEQWKNNPDIARRMISYLGFPVRFPDGKPFGTICLLDTKRNEYSETVQRLMRKFRRIIESDLEIIYLNQVLGDKNRRLSDYLMELQAFRGIVPICSNCKSIRDDQGRWHPVEEYLIKNPEAQLSHGLCPACLKKLYPDFTQ